MNYRVIIGALALATSICHADSTLSVDIQKLTYEDGAVDIEPVALSLSYGYGFYENFSVVGRFGVGMNRDSADGLVLNAKFGVEQITGLYAKGVWMEESTFQPYAYLGYTRVELEGQSGADTYRQTESDLGYGFGVSYKASETYSLHLDYSKLIDSSEAELSSLNLGFLLTL